MFWHKISNSSYIGVNKLNDFQFSFTNTLENDPQNSSTGSVLSISWTKTDLASTIWANLIIKARQGSTSYRGYCSSTFVLKFAVICGTKQKPNRYAPLELRNVQLCTLSDFHSNSGISRCPSKMLCAFFSFQHMNSCYYTHRWLKRNYLFALSWVHRRWGCTHFMSCFDDQTYLFCPNLSVSSVINSVQSDIGKGFVYLTQELNF